MWSQVTEANVSPNISFIPLDTHLDDQVEEFQVGVMQLILNIEVTPYLMHIQIHGSEKLNFDASKKHSQAEQPEQTVNLRKISLSTTNALKNWFNRIFYIVLPNHDSFSHIPQPN